MYHYDVSDPQVFAYPPDPEALPWNANRLLYLQTFDDTDPQNPVLVSTTYYLYNNVGNPVEVTTELANPLPGQKRFESTAIHYDRKGQTVTHVAIMEADGFSTNKEYTFARAYRYDGARQRYLTREYDLQALSEGSAVITREVWSDYDGDELYASYTATSANPPVIGDLVHYEPRLGEVLDPMVAKQSRLYVHDHLGTVVSTHTPFYPSNPEHRVFTAYGEAVSAPLGQPRLGYAGAWGYQGDPGSRLLHVGHRYYDPAAGRFLQRDPIGIAGGLDTYAYVSAQPTLAVDPDGLKGMLPPGARTPYYPIRCLNSPIHLFIIGALTSGLAPRAMLATMPLQ